jgi:hypothetical protein
VTLLKSDCRKRNREAIAPGGVEERRRRCNHLIEVAPDRAGLVREAVLKVDYKDRRAIAKAYAASDSAARIDRARFIQRVASRPVAI